MEHSKITPPFETVASELSPALLRYLRRYVGDPTIAEDLLQESLIRIARGLPGFEGNASLKTWAFSIATHVATDYFRAPERRQHMVAVDEAAELPDPERALDEGLVIDEMNHCVRQVIDSLPENYRASIVLHDLEGMSAQETADICGCTLATAKIRIHRARSRLRDALNQQCNFYRDADDIIRCDRKQMTIPGGTLTVSDTQTCKPSQT